MQNRQYELCVRVLRKLHNAGVLSHLVLIGSWCLLLYREFFKEHGRILAVRTRDMDFLVPSCASVLPHVDLPALLGDLGFITGFKGEKGVMVLEHPELMIELLVPERGRGSDGVRQLPQLGMNAQPLRFLDLPSMLLVRLSLEGVPVTVPHPAAFALHKLLVVPRRKNPAKRQKDLDAAVQVLDLLEKKNELQVACQLLARLPRPWQRSVATTLRATQQAHWLNRLTGETGTNR